MVPWVKLINSLSSEASGKQSLKGSVPFGASSRKHEWSSKRMRSDTRRRQSQVRVSSFSMYYYSNISFVGVNFRQAARQSLGNRSCHHHPRMLTSFPSPAACVKSQRLVLPGLAVHPTIFFSLIDKVSWNIFLRGLVLYLQGLECTTEFRVQDLQFRVQPQMEPRLG